ncbi:MAG TPA: ATP synthase F1 subunit gamma [Polyangiales bacterium]|nr:ATP synthase F1 subunit gamma [Polyangiales bacterium]
MAGLKEIKRRISGAKNTRKITRAMKMISAARLRKAQQRITELRPYAQKTIELLTSVASRVNAEDDISPLLRRREENKVLIVVITSDRGLAGAFNASINKRAFAMWKQLEKEGKQVSFAVIGRKGGDFFRRRGANIEKVFSGMFENITSAKAGEIGRYIVGRYLEEDLDAAYLVYNEFKSAIAQIVTVQRVLPVELPEAQDEAAQTDYIYEPDQKALLERLLPMYMEVTSFRALLDSVASEHGARMTAMDNAMNNASDVIASLTLKYNRARQAAITKELMEIIGGAEALKG